MSTSEIKETSSLPQEFVDLIDEFMGEKIISFTAWREIVDCETEEDARKILEQQFDSPKHAREAEAYMKTYLHEFELLLAGESENKQQQLRLLLRNLYAKMTELGSKGVKAFFEEVRGSDSTLTIEQIIARYNEECAMLEASDV
jgi:hypothetical protein